MNELKQFLDTLVEHLNDHAVKILTGLALMAIGWFLGRSRARAHWQKQEFFDRLNVSLNILEHGRLKLRTLSEKRCADVFLNTHAADAVQKLARQTTATDPLLPIPQKDYWYYLNAVLNDLSEQFAHGHLRQDLGQPVKTASYLICLTCESSGELRTRKIRALVMRKDVLTNLPKEAPQFAAPNHQTRWVTLQAMAAEYAKNPWRFLEVELSA